MSFYFINLKKLQFFEYYIFVLWQCGISNNYDDLKFNFMYKCEHLRRQVVVYNFMERAWHNKTLTNNVVTYL